jgi:hypothetical protein
LTDIAYPASAFAAAEGARRSPAIAQRLLNLVLFVAVVASGFVFIEPSPHDALMLVLLAMCVAARVRFDRRLIPLLVLLIVWVVGGFLSLIQVGDEEKAIQYVGTSLYLDVAAIMFACLFCDGDETRLLVVRRAYILAALSAAAAGYIGFFHLLPGSDMFLTNDRVSATFKDANVFGPFLIYPILLLIIGGLTRGIKLVELAVAVTLMGGLFLSFSRGAWLHFTVSATVAVGLLLAVMPSPRMRVRIVVLSILAVIGVTLFVLALTSVSSIHDLFLERAQVIQSYDVGPGGRFWLQQLALTTILDHPNGMGPFEFDRVFGLQQHNVYLQGFLVYGWLGGATYVTLVVVTLFVGLRAVRLPTPWQTYLIAAFAAFVGEVVEGMIVDTDHWRHFFLLLGLIWGLTAATINHRRMQWQS